MEQNSNEMESYLAGEVMNDFQGAIKQEKEVFNGCYKFTKMEQNSNAMESYLAGEVMNDFHGAIKQEKEVFIGDHELPHMHMREWCPSYNQAVDTSINHNLCLESKPSMVKTLYYTIFNDMRKTECMECGKVLSGTRKANIKRHYKLVHKKDIKVGREARSSDEDYADQSSMNDTQKETTQDYAKPYVFNNELIVPMVEQRLKSVDEQTDDKAYNQSDERNNADAEKHSSSVAHYKILRDIQKTECLECGKVLSGTRKLNIMRHYKLVHKKIIEYGREASSSSDDDYTEPPLKRPKTYNSFSLNIDESKFLKCCVGLVTAKNLPFKIFDDREFLKTLILPYEKKFGTDLNSKNIVSVLDVAVGKIFNKIKKRVRNKLISLKIDVATQKDKGMVAVNIQHLKDFKVCYNTLGVLHLHKQQEPPTLNEQIKKLLRSYEIDTVQIYSITTDNGTNGAKSLEILQEFDEELNAEKLNQTEADINGTCIEEIIRNDIASVMQPTRSLAHTIHLVASDVLRQIHVELIQGRDLVKKLRAAPATVEFEVPEQDNATCWYSTYKMLKSLYSIKEYVRTENVINWDFIKNFLTAFDTLAKCAEQQHNDQYVAGDFYRDWFSCELELEDLFASTPYAKPLLDAMQSRKQELFDNVAFTSALYLDPRFNFLNSTMLSDEQKHKAVENLVKTYEMIQNLENSQTQYEPQNGSLTEDQHQVNEDLSIKESIDTEKPYAKMAKHIASLIARTTKNSESQRTIKQKLILLSNCKMIPIHTDILHYFRYTMLDPDITKIIEVAMAFPANQVLVRRTYSGLEVTLKKSNKNVNSNIVNNIVLAKLNARELASKHVRVEYPDS